LEGGEPTPIPARVGATEIEQVRTARQVFECWSFVYSGELARDAIMAQLRWSAGLLDAMCPTRLRSELYSAIGDLAETAAIGTTALDAADAIPSHQILDALRELARHAAVHRNLDEIAHLQQRIGTLVPPHD
jgi:hypothetical protein